MLNQHYLMLLLGDSYWFLVWEVTLKFWKLNISGEKILLPKDGGSEVHMWGPLCIPSISENNPWPSQDRPTTVRRWESWLWQDQRQLQLASQLKHTCQHCQIKHKPIPYFLDFFIQKKILHCYMLLIAAILHMRFRQACHWKGRKFGVFFPCSTRYCGCHACLKTRPAWAFSSHASSHSKLPRLQQSTPAAQNWTELVAASTMGATQ